MSELYKCDPLKNCMCKKHNCDILTGNGCEYTCKQECKVAEDNQTARDVDRYITLNVIFDYDKEEIQKHIDIIRKYMKKIQKERNEIVKVIHAGKARIVK